MRYRCVLRNLLPSLPPTTRVVGFEPSTDAISVGATGDDRIEIIASDARKCDETFDLVLMLDVFEHIEDYIGFLRALRGNGQHFIFHIPLDMSVQAVMRMTPIMAARRVTGHLHYFSKETALATLEDCGLRVVDHFYTRGAIELSRQALRTRVAALPRSVAFRWAPDLAARVLGGFSLLVLASSGK